MSAVSSRRLLRLIGSAVAVGLALSGATAAAQSTPVLRAAANLVRMSTFSGTPPAPQAWTRPQRPSPRSSLSLGWGVAEPDWPGSAIGLVAAETTAGRRANLILTYVHWGGGWSAFDQLRTGIVATLQRGSTPVITWMSDDPTAGSQSAYDLRSIASGSWDAYARSWADGLRALRSPVVLRLDSEMNGNWMTYSPGYSGNGTTAADFVAAWRHLHDIFRQERATNVSWVWSPNVQYPGSLALHPLYPGDAYVDWVALDGYNWGTTNGHAWQSFGEVFDSSIAAVEALTSRPFMIAETASTQVGGDKAAWISDMFAELAARRDIHGFIWFDFDKETNWRIASDPASAAAFRSGLGRLATP